MKLKNKRILLTGGAGGLGSLTAQSLIAQGARLTVVDRTTTVPFDAKALQGDLSSLEGVQAVADEIAETPWDILINLAGIQHFGPFEAQSPAHVAQTYWVNLVAPVLLTHAVLPGMKARSFGQIVNIGSVLGSINFAHFVTYSSSKAGLHGLSEALRRELVGTGVGVTYIAPRAIKTPLNTAANYRFAEVTGMRMDEPERVANRILRAIKRRSREVYIGFPESLFVRVNALLPGVVDSALAKSDRAARDLFVAGSADREPEKRALMSGPARV